MAHSFNPSTQEAETEGPLRVQGHSGRHKVSLKENQSQAVMAHTFNSSTWETHDSITSSREVETDREWLGREGDIRREETGIHSIQSEDL